MDSSQVQKALDSSLELQITVTGRKTGRQHSTPVWFVREGKTIFLMPTNGSKNQWYKNGQMSKKDQDLGWKSCARPSCEPINRIKEGCLHRGEVPKEIWRWRCEKVLHTVRRGYRTHSSVDLINPEYRLGLRDPFSVSNSSYQGT